MVLLDIVYLHNNHPFPSEEVLVYLSLPTRESPHAKRVPTCQLLLGYRPLTRATHTRIMKPRLPVVHTPYGDPYALNPKP